MVKSKISQIKPLFLQWFPNMFSVEIGKCHSRILIKRLTTWYTSFKVLEYLWCLFYLKQLNWSITLYSFLGNPMGRGACLTIVHGMTRVGHDLVTKSPPAWLMMITERTLKLSWLDTKYYCMNIGAPWSVLYKKGFLCLCNGMLHCCCSHSTDVKINKGNG